MKSNLPESWELTTLSEIADWSSGGTPTAGNSNYYGGDIPWLIIGDLNDGYIDSSAKTLTKEGFDNSSAKMVPIGSVLVAMYGSIGKLGITNIECATNQAIAFTKNIKQGIPNKFLFYYLFSQKAALLKLGKGGAQANISQTVLKEVPFPLPPLAEQRRIVAKLDALMQRVEASQARLEKLPGLLKKFRQAVLAAAVSGRLTEAWRAEQPAQETGADLLARIRTERRAQWEAKQRAKLSGKQLSLNDSWKQKYEEPAEPDTSELQELPEGWVWATMPVIGELNRGKSKHRPRNDDALYGGPYPFIQTGDISRANRIITSYRQTYSEFGLEQSKLWPKGTLCITIAANIADTAILGFDACFPDSVVGFLANADNIEIDFVEYFISTAKANIEHYAPATAQKNINLEILSQIAIPLPGFQEQQEIVRQVNHYFALADALEARFEQAAAMVEQLPQALLAKAFSGQLVPQDPSDEPASVLLERLRNAPAPDKPKRGRKAPASTLQLELTVSQSLHEILTQHPDGISPEKLFSLAGFTDLSVDTFYQELATLLPQLHEIKPTGEAAKKWPNTSTTLRLKTVPHAN